MIERRDRANGFTVAPGLGRAAEERRARPTKAVHVHDHFRGGALSAVTIEFPTFDAGREALTPSLGEPGWEGDNHEALDARISDAKRKELGALVAGALGTAIGVTAFGPLVYIGMRAANEAQDLQTEKRLTAHLHCVSWNRALTQALLCEENGTKTTALFTSRIGETPPALFNRPSAQR